MLSMPIVLVNLLLLFAGAAARNLTYSFYDTENDLFLQVSGSLPTSEMVPFQQVQAICDEILVFSQQFCLFPPGVESSPLYSLEQVDPITPGLGLTTFLRGGSLSGDPTFLFYSTQTFALASDYVSGSPIDALIVFEGESLDSAGLPEEPQVLRTFEILDTRTNPPTGIGAFVIVEVLETPSAELSPSPSKAPTTIPSKAPTTIPSKAPTTTPSKALTTSPSKEPTTIPSKAPTTSPSKAPTTIPTEAPTTSPSKEPTTSPSKAPTTIPSEAPTTIPSEAPTEYNGLKLCQITSQVDCDSDSDCAPGLLCADDHKRALKKCGVDQRKVLCVQDGFDYSAIDRRNRAVCFDPTDPRLAECRFD